MRQKYLWAYLRSTWHGKVHNSVGQNHCGAPKYSALFLELVKLGLTEA